jgi:GT2 family glycosyltransferase/glycosyltransferase involved in cell wall biosynthesis
MDMLVIRIILWILFLPAQSLLVVGFFLCDCLCLLRLRFGALKESPSESRMISNEVCSIVMLNWDGRHLLEESVPALENAVRFTGRSHEIIVVDNGSKDGSIDWLRKNHSGIKVVALEENIGFGEGNNRGVEVASHDIVVLLNNDMIVSEEFLSPLLDAFADEQVFAVSSQIFFPEGQLRQETGNTQLRFKRGYPHFSHEPVRSVHDIRRVLPVLWAGGGSSAFHRDRFLELGGFSSLFSPCYFEDTDLSFRAWRRGWKVLIASNSQVLHKHRSSSSTRFSPSQLETLQEVRKLWYLWKNFPITTLLTHLLLLPLHFTEKLSVTTYGQALKKLPCVFAQRIRAAPRRVNERNLFQWIRQPLAYLNHFYPDRAGTPGVPLRILIVSAYLPRLGQHGGGNRVFYLLREVARKHEVSLISFVENEEEVASVSSLRPHCKSIETVKRTHHSPVSLFPYEPFEEFNCPEFRERVAALLAKEDFDVVHFEWPQMAQYADLFRGIPRFLTEVEVNYAAHFTFVALQRNLLKKVHKVYNSLQTLYREVELCRKVDQVICVTDEDRKSLRGYVQERKLSVVNTGVDTKYFTSSESPSFELDSLVFVGAFRHEPNVDAMLYFCRELFPRILEERPQTRLYIVGVGPPESIQALQSNPQVTVTGYVEDIRGFYQRAQVVVVPLRTGVGIRGKILEAWAAGKAVVVTPLACQGIRVVPGENIMIAEDADEFVRQTLALQRDPDLCKRLGRAGRETAVKFYDWSRLGQEMIDLYERVAFTQSSHSGQ